MKETVPAASIRCTFCKTSILGEAGNGNCPEEAKGEPREGRLQRASSRYLTLIDRVASLCTLQRTDAVGSSDEEGDSAAAPATAAHQRRDRGMARRSLRSWIAGRLGRSRKSSDDATGAYFLHMLRADFPEIWAAVVAGTGDTVICVPQSTSLSQEDLTAAEARAHVLTPSEEVPGDFLTLDGWSVSLVGNEVVTGAGFPEWRRVRLLLSEDLGQHLVAAGEQPLCPPAAAPRKAAEASAQATAEVVAGVSRTADSMTGALGKEDAGGAGGGDGGGGAEEADARRKANSNAKVVKMVETNAAGEKEERGDASGKAKTATTVRGGELRKRERKVRVMHVSRPLMGGLSWAPENAGELDMITVDKYTAVLKSYPEVDGMFAEMDSFAKAVLDYCSKNLEARGGSSTAAGGYARASDEAAIINGLGAEQGHPGDGGGSGESKSDEGRVRRPRSRKPQEEELCAVIAEQWRLTATTLTRSRCVKGNGDAEAMERREVTMMQVTESYLMSRLAPGLGAWLAVLHAGADAELRRALKLLRYHTQEDIGVKRPFQCDLSSAVECLRGLGVCATPMDKMLQVKESLKLIQTSVQQNLDARRRADDDDRDGDTDATGSGGGRAGQSVGEGGGGRVYEEDAQMATDDVVLLLVCCLIEAGATVGGSDANVSASKSGDSGDGGGRDGGRTSFLADLAFMKAFHFCEDSTSAVFFAVSTFEVALEWLLAKVGRRLAETPAEDGLGSFLGIEDRPCSASPLPDILGEDGSGVGEAGTDGGGGGGDGAAPPVGDDEGVGAWGGELSVVPAALCDAALRENVRWELEARQGGGAVVAIEDLTGDPTERLPWESVGVEGQRPGARPAEQEQGSSRTNVGRGMVFGDAGKWGAEQSTMFQITDGGGGAAGSEGESEADGGTEGRGEEGAGWSAVDVVQVSCGKHFFAAVARGGGLYTWGLDASDGRLGHGRRGDGDGDGGGDDDGAVEATAAAASAAPAPAGVGVEAAVGAGGAGSAAAGGSGGGGAAGTGADAAGSSFWLKAPVRVAALSANHVVQVSCGARHTLVITSEGHLFAWGDNRYGQCGLPWPSLSPPADSPRGDGDGQFGLKTFGQMARKMSTKTFLGGADKAGDCSDGGKGSGDSGDGMTVFRPTRVLLWQEGDDLPLRVLQVASGRQHSLAIACSRSNDKARVPGNSAATAATAAATAAAAAAAAVSVHSATTAARVNRRANVLYSWGAAGSGRLGRLPLRNPSSSPFASSPYLTSPSPRQPPPPPPPPPPHRSKSDSLAGVLPSAKSSEGGGGGSSGREDTAAGGRRRSGSLAGWSASGGGGGGGDLLGERRERGEGGRGGSRSGDRELPPPEPGQQGSAPRATPAPPPPRPPEAFNMPAPVAADWTYRVNDHRRHGAPLVAVPTPAAAAAAAAERLIYPFGGGDRDGDGTRASVGRPSGSGGGGDGAAGDTEGMTVLEPGDEVGRGPVAIAAGWRHSVAVTVEGAVFAWGCGSDGRLGLGSHVDANAPRQVRALASRAIRVRQAAAGRAHTLFLSESGNVYSCGSNEFGQQGRGGAGSAAQRSSASQSNADGWSRETSRSTHPAADGSGGGGGVSTSLCILAPTKVAVTVGSGSGGGVSGLRVQRVAAGDDHCTVLTSSEPNTATASAAAAAASTAVSASSSRGGGGAGSSQGSSSSRRVFTWGLNAAGQCAHGRAAEVVGAPQEAELLSGARAVGCGAGHTMVVL